MPWVGHRVQHSSAFAFIVWLRSFFAVASAVLWAILGHGMLPVLTRLLSCLRIDRNRGDYAGGLPVCSVALSAVQDRSFDATQLTALQSLGSKKL